MDKYEFMEVVQKNIDDCNTWHDLKVRKVAMIETIEKMFKLEFEYRKCIEECWKDYYNL